MTKLACCYHPATIVIVDDEKTYVDSLKLRFKKMFPCKTYTDPKEALNFLKNNNHPGLLEEHWLVRSKENLLQVDVNLPVIRQEAYNPKRFGQLSILIVDHVMPGLKGLDLCLQLGKTDMQKILLTGKVTTSDAIDAFNDKLIDRYIPKNSPDLIEKLTTMIDELTISYFTNLTSRTSFALRNEYLFLMSNEFIVFLYGFIKENNITEYYLCGSDCFMCLDRDANPSWLIIKTEEDPSIQPVKTFKNNGKNYYCIYTNDSKSYEIEQDKILSYNEYLKNNN